MRSRTRVSALRAVASESEAIKNGRDKVLCEFQGPHHNMQQMLTCLERKAQPEEELDAWGRHRAEKGFRVPVRVRVHLMELTCINTVSQQFDCKAWIQFKWEERGPQGSSSTEAPVRRVEAGMGPESRASGEWKPEWTPDLEFQNVVDMKVVDAKPAHVRAVRAPSCGPVHVYSRYVLRATFAERMELRQFPVDCQRLHIRAILWHCPEAVDDVPLSQPFGDCPPMRTVKFEIGTCEVYQDSFIQKDAWTLYDRIIVKQGLTNAKHNDDGLRFTTLNIYVCLRRKLGFYWWNIVMPSFLLVLISFASFFFEVSALSDRLNLTLVVLLTLVAFKFVASQYLPSTSYLTYMDMYLVASFFFVFLVALQNLITFLLTDPNRAAAFNRWSGCGVTVAWGALHAAIPLVVLSVRRHQDKNNFGDDGDDADDKELEDSPL